MRTKKQLQLGLQQAIACGKISQQDLNLITKFPEAREALRDAFGSLNVEHINRRLNGAEVSLTTDDTGQIRLMIHSLGSFPLAMTFPPAHLQSSPEPAISPEASPYPSRYATGDPCDHRAERRIANTGTVPCACCGEEICELTQSEVRPGERPLPPFDPSIERISPACPNEALSDAIASGEIEVSRESVSIEEVIAKIEKLQKETIDEHRSNR